MNTEEKRYYVYFHRREDTKEIFYIGKGNGHRSTVVVGRSKIWRDITVAGGWYAEKYKENLTEDEALDLELQLINEFNPVANIHKKDIRKKSIDVNFTYNRYKYSESSPTGLVYKEWNGQYGKKRRDVGDVAGNLNCNGYYTVSCGGSGSILVHRLVWFLLNDEDPLSDVIDHMDGDRTNNSIYNLRRIHPKDNAKNCGIRKNNTTGVVGVNKTQNGFYMATWAINGVPSSKQFSIAKHGEELAFELASHVRLNNVPKDFSDRHVGTFEFKILNLLSKQEIEDLLNDDAHIDSTTGIKNIHLHKAFGCTYWRFRYGKYKSSNFSVQKYGNEVAKQLSIEVKNRFFGGLPKNIEGFTLNETNLMIDNDVPANNRSGVKGLSYLTKKSGETLINARRAVGGKRHLKQFNCKVFGLLPAYAKAIAFIEQLEKL